MDKRRLRPRHLALGSYIVACLSAQTWPAYAWFGNTIEPYVLGVPYSFAWVIGWVLLTFVVLLIYHLTDGRGGESA